MGNSESSSLPSMSPTGSFGGGGDEEEEHNDVAQALTGNANETTPLTWSSSKTKKKKKHAAQEPTTDLHREAHDMAAMSFWVSCLPRILLSTLQKSQQQQQEEGYTPAETLQILREHHENDSTTAADEQQQEQSYLIDSLQELNEQSAAYVQAHSQPGAPRIISSRSLSRRRQRLIERPMTLLLSSSSSASVACHDDDTCYYGIIKDDVNQRIVLAFSETQAMQSASANTTTACCGWKEVFHVDQVHVPLPATLQGKIPQDPNNKDNGKFLDSMGLRADLYQFLFGDDDKERNDKQESAPPDKNNNDSNTTRYHALLASLQHVLRAHPSYAFYVTGFQGRAAACAVLVSFFLAAEPQAILYNHSLFTTNPIVNCLALSCPRVGDANFLQACQYLEKGEPGKDGTGRSPLLRLGRIVVNDRDNNTTDVEAQIPMWGYAHVGFQIRLFHDEKSKTKDDDDKDHQKQGKLPEITYPKLVDHWKNRLDRTLGNAVSIPQLWKQLHHHQQQSQSLNHHRSSSTAAATKYRQAIQQSQSQLQEYKEGMKSLYIHTSHGKDGTNEWTGF